MSDAFGLEPVNAVVNLDEKTREGAVRVDVSNALDGPVKAAAEVQADVPEGSGWVNVEPDSFLLEVNQGRELSIRFAPPSDTPPGEYHFRLRVYDVDRPADAFATSPPITAVVPPKPNGGPRWLLWLLVAAVVLVIGLVIWFIFGREQTVTVPDVTRITVEEALSELEAAGLELGEAIAARSLEPSGTILFQDPDGGNQADVGTAIAVRVAFEDPGLAFEVPEVRRQSADAACELVRAAGLVCETRFIDSLAQEGQVIRQSPSAGEQLDIGDTVTINVSTGS